MKKTISILLTAALLTAGLTFMAGATENPLDKPKTPHYLYTTGTVESVENYNGQKGWFLVRIIDNDGNPAYLVITDRTVFPFKSTIVTGDVVTGFYLADAPMSLIWPPQYNTAIFVSGMPADGNIRADRFYTWEDGMDGYMLAQGGQFAFRIDGNTEIVLANGDDFSDGEIEGRRMVVIYDGSTKSLPEMATAIKVIVLYEDAVPLPETVSPDMPQDVVIDASGWPILVDGTQIDAPDAFQTEDGTVMVPLRVIAEKLGFEVNWDGEMRSVRLGVATHLWIGNTEVNVGRMAPLSISTAPVIVNRTTFVPLDFFINALGMTNAFAFEGQIEIHSEGERME